MPRTSPPLPPIPAPDPALLTLLTPRPAPEFPFSDARTRWHYLGRGAVFQAVRALGLQGADVLVPAWHHGVEVAALKAAGARPVFYDLGPGFEADLASLEASLTPETRALYVIHYLGFPQPLTALCAFARSRGLLLLEDCALALYSGDGTRPLGLAGDAAIFCLHKSLPVPHGGALWLADRPHPAESLAGPSLGVQSQQLASAAVAWLEQQPGPRGRLGALLRAGGRRLHARTRLPADAAPVGQPRWRPEEASRGASTWVRQMVARCDPQQVRERRRRNYATAAAILGDVSPMPAPSPGRGVVPLFYPLWVADKPAMLSALHAQGIGAVDFWGVTSSRVTPGRFPRVDALRRHLLELPIHQGLSLDDVERMATAARRLVTQLGAGPVSEMAPAPRRSDLRRVSTQVSIDFHDHGRT